MTEPESAIDLMVRTVGFSFRPLGGRVRAISATQANPDSFTIELKCEQSGGFFDGTSCRIGSDRHPVPLFNELDDEEAEDKPVEEEDGWRLSTIPIMVTLYEATPAWLEENREKVGGQALAGRFSYHPIHEDSTVSERHRRPHIGAWLALGPETMRAVRRAMMDFEVNAFSLGLTVQFPKQAILENGWQGRSIVWDGQGDLPVMDGSIVWTKEDWSPDFFSRERTWKREAVAEVRAEPDTQIADVVAAVRRLDARTRALVTPLWLTAFLAFFALLLWRS
jgi:hypothetical protein